MVDLRAQHESISSEIDEAIRQIIDSTAFVSGPAVGKFEHEFAEYCGARFAVGVASGTAALRLALRALDIGPGDEVITTTWTFFATVEAIALVGAKPVLVDIDADTYNIDVQGVRNAVTGRTRAIIPVHLFGQPSDMDEINAIAAEHNLKIVEDAAQSHGATQHGKKTGTLGDIACFSFYPSKNLGAYGDGGMVTTDDPHLAERVRSLHDHGRTGKYRHAEIGEGERLDSLQAAILSVKLRHLDDWNRRRVEIATRYTTNLGAGNVNGPVVQGDSTHVYHLYVVRVPDRDRVLADLRESGISAAVHYESGLHLQPALAHLGYTTGSMPVSERASEDVISLPIYPEMPDDYVDRVSEVLLASVRGG